MEKTPAKIISAGILAGIVVASLALVIRSLKKVNLRLFLQLKKK